MGTIHAGLLDAQYCLRDANDPVRLALAADDPIYDEYADDPPGVGPPNPTLHKTVITYSEFAGIMEGHRVKLHAIRQLWRQYACIAKGADADSVKNLVEAPAGGIPVTTITA